MVKKFKKFGPQLVFAEQAESAIALTNEQKLSIYKKSQKSGFSTDILEEVYRRGYSIWNKSFGQTAEQFAFDRVNSFISGGFAADLDSDLMIKEGMIKSFKRGLQGWSGNSELPLTGSANKPKDIVSRTKASDTETLKKLADNDAPEHSPAHLQSRVAKKELAKRISEQVKEPTGDLKDACWKGYTAVGMKMKNGRKVPNCVPVKEDILDEAGIGNVRPLKSSAKQEWREKLKLSAEKRKAANKPQMSKDELRQMAADAMKNTAKMQKVTEQLKPVPSADKIADKFKKPEDQIEKAINTGSKVEKEHTKDVNVAKKIATAHVNERPDYYTRLKKVEEATIKSPHKSSRHFKTSETAELQSVDPNDPDSRFDGTTSATNVYKKSTPGQSMKESTYNTIRKTISEATYKGRKVSLNKPFRTPGGPKKSAVYVDPDGDGKAKIVRFGDPNLSIKKDQPARKRSYCARSSGQGNLTKKDSANYWSRRAWNCEETINELSVPAGTTGRRTEVSTPLVAIRMASGKIEKHPPGKSGSSGGGGDEE